MTTQEKRGLRIRQVELGRGDTKGKGILPNPAHCGNEIPNVALGNKEADNHSNMLLEAMGLKLVDSMGEHILLVLLTISKRGECF